MKYSKYYRKIRKNSINDNRWLTKLLLSIIIVLICLIVTNFSVDLKNEFVNTVLEDNLDFSFFRKYYDTYVVDSYEDDTMVVGVTNLLDYKEIDGSYRIDVNQMEGVSALAGGIVVYVGEKDNLGNTVIIQGNDGVDIWYSNIELLDFSLYDYVSKDTILGNSLSNYYLISIFKDGKKLKYEEYFG